MRKNWRICYDRRCNRYPVPNRYPTGTRYWWRLNRYPVPNRYRPVPGTGGSTGTRYPPLRGVPVPVPLGGLGMSNLMKPCVVCGEALKDNPQQKGDLSRGLSLLLGTGAIYREKGPRNSWLYYPAEGQWPPSSPGTSSPEWPRDETPSRGSSPRVAPSSPGPTESSGPDPLYGGGATTTDSGVVDNG